ncbi:MAG TPA: FmdB family zinc ribbon protein [Opitutaceae bacterium]|nr:FmdB family zinc ribbon protein [Opitutaceae bacterium]
MPTYEYICRNCGAKFEVFQSMKDPPLKTCPRCRKGSVKRLVGRGAGVIFKGSGFYETDYKRAPAKPDGGKPKGDSAGKSDSPAASASGSTGAAAAPPAPK